jgi:hypothetical protein
LVHIGTTCLQRDVPATGCDEDNYYDDDDVNILENKIKTES